MDKKTMEYMKVRVDRAVVIENKLKKANAVLKSLRDGQYNFYVQGQFPQQGWSDFGSATSMGKEVWAPILSEALKNMLEEYIAKLEKEFQEL